DTNNLNDVFLYDVQTGINTLVSHAFNSITTAGDQSSETFYGDMRAGSTISADGRLVTYQSGASNLISGFVDNDGQYTSAALNADIYLYDRLTGTNVLVSHNSISASAS